MQILDWNLFTGTTTTRFSSSLSSWHPFLSFIYSFVVTFTAIVIVIIKVIVKAIFIVIVVRFCWESYKQWWKVTASVWRTARRWEMPYCKQSSYCKQPTSCSAHHIVHETTTTFHHHHQESHYMNIDHLYLQVFEDHQDSIHNIAAFANKKFEAFEEFSGQVCANIRSRTDSN